MTTKFSETGSDCGGDAILAHKIDELEGMLREHMDEVAKFRKMALPDGDPVAHRMAHEAMMRAAQAQEKFWNELKLDVAKKGVIGILVILVGLIVIGLYVKLGLAASAVSLGVPK